MTMQPRLYPAVSPEVARLMAMAALRIAVDQLEIYADSGEQGAEYALSAVDILDSVVEGLEECVGDERPDTDTEMDAAEESDMRRLCEWADRQTTRPEEFRP